MVAAMVRELVQGPAHPVIQAHNPHFRRPGICWNVDCSETGRRCKLCGVCQQQCRSCFCSKLFDHSVTRSSNYSCNHSSDSGGRLPIQEFESGMRVLCFKSWFGDVFERYFLAWPAEETSMPAVRISVKLVSLYVMYELCICLFCVVVSVRPMLLLSIDSLLLLIPSTKHGHRPWWLPYCRDSASSSINNLQQHINTSTNSGV